MTTLSKVQNLATAKVDLEEMERLRKRAARQAKQNIAVVAVPTVDCEVLPQGDGRISMGEHFGGVGDAYFEEAETITALQLPVAISLYEKGYVKFDGAKEAAAEQRERLMAAARARLEAERNARAEAEAVELEQYM